MTLADTLDVLLDRSIVLGYGTPGLSVRRRLPNWPADPPRMDGQVVLVTGAGSGLGLAAAAGFARLGATVHALGRDAGRAEDAVRMAREQAPGGDVHPAVCDVSSVDALHAFVERFRSEQDRLDVLVNNAGVMPEERQETVDGVELTFATHVVAPWVLIEGLTPLLRRGNPGRVIDVTSGGQYGQQVPAGDLESSETSYGPKKIYARTKREQLVITQQWAEKLRGSGIVVHAMHPGWADTKGVENWMPVFRALTRPVIRTPEQGADTIVWLGAAPGPAGSTGRLWHDRRSRPATYRFGAKADDAAARREVWDRVAAIGGRRSGA